MSFDVSIKQMLDSYPEATPQIDRLREILQQTALLGLVRHQFFEHAVFYGGTALRILYGLDRYSEDLDFSLLQPNPDFNFAPFLEGMHRELEAMGFQLDVAVRKKNSETGIWSAFLKANTFSLMLSIHEKKQVKGIHPDQKIQIKLEIDTDPPLEHLPLERKLVKNPVPFYVVTYTLVDLFAGKMHAVLCRNWHKRIKGRDWYDLIWYIQKDVPVNLTHLRERMRQTHHLDAEEKLGKKELLERLHKKIAEINWEHAKADVQVFIPDKRKLDLWSAQFFHDMVAHLQVVDG
ncbi:MAG: nucleotidyl transferase AbiEii/AbiGii toxin family protein [Rhabdochlamydiaceae bacterium]|nr:nucleotidyl transferase AbiEii/AbiGii toxin family protein [Rhabdochlamydiaceae bacterium]